MSNADLTIVRDLAQQYVAICREDVQRERRSLWRRHNSLQFTRPLIYVRAFAWHEMPESACRCEDPFWRRYEYEFRWARFLHTLNDDFIFEPWLTVDAATWTPPGGVWGLEVKWTRPSTPGGSGVWDAPIKGPEDLRRIAEIHHRIDEEETARRLARVRDGLGDILPVCVDRAPVWRTWNGDISTQLAFLRGLEQMMVDMAENQAFLHELLTIMRDGILRTHEEAERAGDWRLCDHQNQAMPYAAELADPIADSQPVSRRRLWYFAASQETTGVGPAMFDEFMLQYQLPILKPFGLVAYGCCEDLTRKIKLLRQIPNLRRIAVTPRADVAKCVEQIGTDYVVSYRPSPADMVSYRFDPERVRSILRHDLALCRHCHVDITLKDVETVERDPNRVRRWVEITREVIAELWG